MQKRAKWCPMSIILRRSPPRRFRRSCSNARSSSTICRNTTSCSRTTRAILPARRSARGLSRHHAGHARHGRRRYFGPTAAEAHTAGYRRPAHDVPPAGLLQKIPRDIGGERPCLNYQMGAATDGAAPCMQQADYHARLEQAVLLLEGKHQSLCQELQEKMEAAAEGCALSARRNTATVCAPLSCSGRSSSSRQAQWRIQTSSAGTRRRRRPALQCCTLSRAI